MMTSDRIIETIADTTIMKIAKAPIFEETSAKYRSQDREFILEFLV
jgi:hypothetical protein